MSYSQNEVGNIRGKLIDKQLNEPIINHPVTLRIHRAGNVTKQETTTDGNGVYRFENLPINFQTHYTVSATYDGTEYIEEDLVLSSLVPNLVVDVNIGGKTDDDVVDKTDDNVDGKTDDNIDGKTDDPSQIQVTLFTLIVGLPPTGHTEDGAVSIFEAIELENKSDLLFQTTRNNEPVSFYWTLPKGFEMFESFVPTTLKINSTKGHVMLADPLPPKQSSIGYRYIFHVDGLKLDLSRPLGFHTNEISILIPEGINLVPHLKHFQQTKSQVYDNVIYKNYRAKPQDGFAAGKTVNLELGIPKQKTNIGQMVFIAIAASLAGGFLVAAIFMLRSAHRASTESDSSPAGSIDVGWLRKLNDADLEHARTARLEFITLLDEMHENNDISERVYNRLRKEHTDRLTEILEQRTERGLDN